MANFNPAFLTTKGLALLTKAQAGKTTILFTKAKTGEGNYIGDETAHPEEQTDLKDPKQEFPISTITISDHTTVYLKFIASNYQDQTGLAEGYHVKEVGIFAEDPEEGEILYALAVAVEEQWDYMPAYNNLLPSTITMEFYTTVANAAEVYLKAGSGAYVCQEDFEAYKAEMTETIADMSKNNEVEFDDVSDPSDVPDPAEAIEQIASGKSVPVLMGHIKTTLRGILALAQRAMNVALGRNQARVFATVEELDEWLAVSENTDQLNVGDNFYITATEVPDYWWDGTTKQPLETQKVDLTTYDQQISALQAADSEINGNITSLSQKMQSFENTKSEIANSALGKALGMLASHTWAQIVAVLKGVVNRGTLNWSGSNTTYSVPAGYYPGGTLDSRPSYTNGYNAGVTAGKRQSIPFGANVNTCNYNTVINIGILDISGSNDVFSISNNAITFKGNFSKITITVRCSHYQSGSHNSIYWYYNLNTNADVQIGTAYDNSSKAWSSTNVYQFDISNLKSGDKIYFKFKNGHNSDSKCYATISGIVTAS